MHALSTLETPARLTDACYKVGNVGYVLARELRSWSSTRERRSATRGRRSFVVGADVILEVASELTAHLLAHHLAPGERIKAGIMEIAFGLILFAALVGLPGVIRISTSRFMTTI